MRTLYEDAYFRVDALDAEKILRVTRSKQPFETVAEAERVFVGLGDAVGKHALDGMTLLLDSREGPGRNDEAFESMMTEKRSLLFGRFARRAILFRTMAGMLQSQRLDREVGGRFHVEPFMDEEKALAYLRS